MPSKEVLEHSSGVFLRPVTSVRESESIGNVERRGRLDVDELGVRLIVDLVVESGPLRKRRVRKPASFWAFAQPPADLQVKRRGCCQDPPTGL